MRRKKNSLGWTDHTGHQAAEAKLGVRVSGKVTSPFPLTPLHQHWEPTLWTRPPEPNGGKVGLEGAGDQACRPSVNICLAVGRLDISVLKHCNLISLSKLSSNDKSLFNMNYFLWVPMGSKLSRHKWMCISCAPAAFNIDNCPVVCRYANQSCKSLKYPSILDTYRHL